MRPIELLAPLDGPTFHTAGRTPFQNACALSVCYVKLSLWRDGVTIPLDFSAFLPHKLIPMLSSALPVPARHDQQQQRLW